MATSLMAGARVATLGDRPQRSRIQTAHIYADFDNLNADAHGFFVARRTRNLLNEYRFDTIIGPRLMPHVRQLFQQL